MAHPAKLGDNLKILGGNRVSYILDFLQPRLQRRIFLVIVASFRCNV
jgi:hypothetical protein